MHLTIRTIRGILVKTTGVATIVATSQYEDVLRQVRSLSPADQKRLLDEITAQIEPSPKQTSSILQLQGLGKYIWANLDAQEYVNQERSSWTG